MTTIWKVAVLGVCLPILWLQSAQAGSYAFTVNCDSTPVNGFCDPGTDINGALVPAFAINHPPGYTGQSVLVVDVCVEQLPPQPDLSQVTASAVATWEAATPMLGNCLPFCSLPEDLSPGGIYDAESVVLHELGHALGLGHPNLQFRDPVVNAFVHTSFSAAHTGSPIGVLVGNDEIRGSEDDFMDNIGGTTATNVTWFRENDNDPFVIDSSVIDINSYSRATNTSLPPGSTWAANANFCHGFEFGHPRTHSVMYSTFTTLMEYEGLTADDVNMLKMQHNGQNRVYDGGAGDDYSLTLNFVTDCTGAEIKVTWGIDMDPGTLGGTASEAQSTFGTTAHYTLVPVSGVSAVYILLNPDMNWSFSGVFADGFESGDASRWSIISPLADPGSEARPDDHPYFCPIGPPPTLGE